MTDQYTEDLKAAAYHEAGHLVVAEVCIMSELELMCRIMAGFVMTREEALADNLREAGFKFSRCAAAVFLAYGESS